MSEKISKPSDENLIRLRTTLGNDLAKFVLNSRRTGNDISIVKSSESAPMSSRRLKVLAQRLQESQE